jgi:hypothetical protein
MNNKKRLSIAILLILAKSALAIEVEPNNNSDKANPLGTENIGQLSQGSDVDFFKIEPKDNNDISITFSCDNKALASNQSARGWYLGIHDEQGQLQSSYPVTSTDCAIGNSTTPKPYSFSFARGTSSKFYVSIVADCHVPIYSTNPANFNVTVNDVVKATPATLAEITTTSNETANAKIALTQTKTDLAAASFVLIGANAQIADITDALALTTDIVKSAISDAIPETTVNAATSAATAAKVSSWAISYWAVTTHPAFITAKAAANSPSVQANIDSAKAGITTATTAVTNATTALADANAVSPPVPADVTAARTALATANTNKAAADNTLAAAQATQTNLNTALTNATTVDTDALARIGDAYTALKNAVTVLNNTVNADIKAAQASTSVDSRSNNSCAASNTAPYKIEVNKSTSTPDGDGISTDKTKIYAGTLTANIINKKSFAFKLTNCGLNKNASLTVNVKSPIAMTIQKNQTPINIQIGDTSCQILTPDTIIPTANEEGSIVGTSKIIDSNLIAKDSTTLTLGECGDTNTKISLTGTKLDFVDFNPVATTAVSTTAVDALDAAVIPVKISIGDFHCEAKEAFYIYKNLPTSNEKTYSNSLIQKKSTSTSITTKPISPFFK